MRFTIDPDDDPNEAYDVCRCLKSRTARGDGGR
jgi:hypothetical protein